MSNQPVISIIVAVYNQQKYLSRCVDSLLRQTFKEFEILLVDDGSTDNSPHICDQYSAQDSRIRSFHKKNTGVSATRQFGLDYARGEYVIHVDADDWVESRMLESLYAEALRGNFDMVVCDFYYDWGNRIERSDQKTLSLTPHNLSISLCNGLHGSSWNKFIKLEVIRKYNIRYPEMLNQGEDLCFNICLLQNNLRISYLPLAFLHYCHNNQHSLTSNSQVHFIEEIQRIEEYLSQNLPVNVFEEYDCYLQRLAAKTAISIRHYESECFKKKFPLLYKKYKILDIPFVEKISFFLAFKQMFFLSKKIGSFSFYFKKIRRNILNLLGFPTHQYSQIAIDCSLVNFKINRNASSKARLDVTNTLKNEKWDIYEKNYPLWFQHPLFRKLAIVSFFLRFRKYKTILFQYPCFLLSFWLIKKLSALRIRIVLLVHDTELLRHPGSARKEIDLFNSAEILIVHTDSMKNELQKQGVRSKQLILGLFDYYAKNMGNYKVSDVNYKSIVFAGNINKSLFLKHLQETKINIPFYLYGTSNDGAFPSCISCEGSFASDDIGEIKGGFGLVWDGDSSDGCATTDIGNYLKYNLSHKLSLYMACGKPVVVWKESAAADWVRKKDLGFAVASLDDAFEKINQCSWAEYQRMGQNISHIQQKLLHGEFLKQVISQL